MARAHFRLTMGCRRGIRMMVTSNTRRVISQQASGTILWQPILLPVDLVIQQFN